jgi:hypothetical protein
MPLSANAAMHFRPRKNSGIGGKSKNAKGTEQDYLEFLLEHGNLRARFKMRSISCLAVRRIMTEALTGANALPGITSSVKTSAPSLLMRQSTSSTSTSAAAPSSSSRPNKHSGSRPHTARVRLTLSTNVHFQLDIHIAQGKSMQSRARMLNLAHLHDQVAIDHEFRNLDSNLVMRMG